MARITQAEKGRSQRQTKAPSELPKEKWIQKRGHSVTYSVLVLFTIVLYFRPYEYLALPATLAFWIGLLLVAVYLPTQLLLAGNLTERPREVNLVLLLTLCALLSIPLAIRPNEGYQAFIDQFGKAVLIFIVTVNAVSSERRLKGLLWLALAVSCTLSIAALLNYRAGLLTVEGYRVGGSIGGMFSNPNEMALQLVTILPIAIGLLLGTRGLVSKVFYGACAALMAAGITVTFSRGAFLGLLGAIVVLLWKIGRRHRLSAMMVVLIATASFIAIAPGGYGQRVLSIFNSDLDPNASSTLRRQVLWRSIYVALRHPLLGVGIGNFHILSIRELVTHNAYTQVASEMGMAALAFYTLFVITPLRRLRQMERDTFAERNSSRFYYLAVALQASLVAYMVSSFFASVAYQWYVYYLVAYAVVWRRLYATRAVEAKGVQEGTHAGQPDDRGQPLVDAGQAAEAFADNVRSEARGLN